MTRACIGLIIACVIGATISFGGIVVVAGIRGGHTHVEQIERR